MDNNLILKKIKAQLNFNGHILGVAVGSGLTAKLAAMGGADFLLTLTAGKYRIMGRSSLSSYFCYGNNNEQVMTLGTREIFPIVRNTPVFFGFMACDPTISLYEYIVKIKNEGFSGIVNYPTVSLIDGKFREALEEEGNTYEQEVAAINIASHLNLVTMAFVTNKEEATRMIKAGANIICIHLGLTKGGLVGAKKYLPIGEAKKVTSEVFNVCKELNPDVLRLVYAGPAISISDLHYLYQNTDCQGYIGGSTFDRIPIENSVYEKVKLFKNSYTEESSLNHYLQNIEKKNNLIESITKYIDEHYMDNLTLSDLALVANISCSYLSVRFKNEIGVSFSEYLLSYRMKKAQELLSNCSVSCKMVASSVGYLDYPQFSKTFKRITGLSPQEYQKKNSTN